MTPIGLNTAIALVGLALGLRHFLRYAGERRRRAALRSALDDWETEGGAVPVTRHAIAAQTGT